MDIIIPNQMIKDTQGRRARHADFGRKENVNTSRNTYTVSALPIPTVVTKERSVTIRASSYYIPLRKSRMIWRRMMTTTLTLET